VRTRSTRKNSGGKSAFAADGEIEWVKFKCLRFGTILELRASSPNLQDTIPGIVYLDKAGNLCTQQYANCKRLDDAPGLPDDLLAWWERLSTDLAFRHAEEKKFFSGIASALGLTLAELDYSPATSITSKGKVTLAFSAPGHRQAYNAAHTVEEHLDRHGYTWHPRLHRWSHPGATGSPGIYPVPGKNGDLWRSDHGGDPLSGAFDAWSAFVILDHHGDVEAAKRAVEAEGLIFDTSSIGKGMDAGEPRQSSRRRENCHGAGTNAATGVQLDDFHAYMPMHAYIFAPSGEMWPGSSVNARLPPQDVNGKALKPAEWLDRYKPVEQMTWMPGKPALIENKLISNGGWIERPGCRCFNLYRPPQIVPGDPGDVEPWLSHLWRVYPDDAAHILRWLAQRVQRPDVKVNHALVLGGAQGIGKDTILEPVKYAIGPWNFSDVTPPHLLGRFNGFVKSVILRVNEARDLGDVDRYAFYDHMKVYTAAPPDMLRCDEKNVREYAVPNVTGVIITSNHKTDGIYLPPDDRRHYVAWSELSKEEFAPDYWTDLYGWYEDQGHANVTAYLRALDLSAFDPKAPPAKTSAFYDIVDANRAPEDADLADILDACGNPRAITLDMLVDKARHTRESFHEWLTDRKNRRSVPHRLESADYIPVRNDATKDGLWKIHGKRQAVYALKTLSIRDRIAAVGTLGRGGSGQ
jgi:hypothetical protein